MADRAITNTGLQPLDELLARTKRVSEQTSRTAIDFGNRLSAQDAELSALKLTVKGIDNTVDGVKLDVRGLSSKVETILNYAAAADAARVAHEKLQAEERDRRGKRVVAYIAALGAALAGIVAAALHGCAS